MIFMKNLNIPDLVVIGGGSAGFAAAIRAADLGATDIRIYEDGVVGGTCLNRGCLPTKNLLQAAERYYHYRHPGFAGLLGGNAPMDFAQLIQQKDNLVESMRKAKYLNVLDALPQVRLISNRARFIGPDCIKVKDEIVKFNAAVIATGASSLPLSIPGLKEAGYLTYKEAINLKSLPRRILVIGGGPMGLELGQFFSRCGSEVVILEAMSRIAPMFEPEVAGELALALRREGIEVQAEAKVSSVRLENGSKLVTAKVGSEQVSWSCDEILLTAGLRPNTQDIGLAEAGVEVDEKGYIKVDAHQQTTRVGTYAAGDCVGAPMLVTSAAYEGAVAAENAIGRLGTAADEAAIPSAIFTEPQVAMVGLGEALAQKKIRKVICETVSFEHVPRAGAVQDTTGVIKLVVEDGSYMILGAHICGSSAAELIMIGTLAVRHRLTLGDIIRSIFVYPTYAEAFKIAALAFRRDVSKLSCCAA